MTAVDSCVDVFTSRSGTRQGPDIEELRALGLTAEESEIYAFLVDRKAVTLDELREGQTASSWRSPAGALASLEAKGLVSTTADTPRRHTAIAPDVALDNLANAREQELATARVTVDELARRWLNVGRAVDPRSMIEIVVGRSATLQRAEQIQRASTDEVLILDKPPYAGAATGNSIEAHLLAAGRTAYRCIYDRAALELPGSYAKIAEMVSAGESARVTPGLPTKMVMGDGRIALLPLEAEPDSIEVAAIVHPSALLDSLQMLFELLWQRATPWTPSTQGDATAGRSPLDERIVRLLVTGLTDKAIGRQLDLAERTVQRRVRVLMRAYGIDNRLQLGIGLAKDGWA